MVDNEDFEVHQIDGKKLIDKQPDTNPLTPHLANSPKEASPI